MALTIEETVDALSAYTYARFQTELDVVSAATDTLIPLPAPTRDRYYIGETNRFVPYQGPALSWLTDRTQFTDVTRGTSEALNHGDKMEHRIFADLLVEMPDEQQLTRACWRYARALKACLDGADVFTTVTSRSCKVFISSVDYGATFTNQKAGQRQFRKDILVECYVKHWDQPGPLGASPTGTPQIEETSAIVASTNELLLTTTNATLALSYQPPSAGGNFLINLYYRVVTAATDVTITYAWTDGGGAQSVTIVQGNHVVGSDSVQPVFINATGSSAITITATAGTANQVYLSASIEAL